MPCKHAELAAIYAKQMAEYDEPWKFWEYKLSGETEWIRPHNHICFHHNWEYRQIPKTIKINGFEVPEPMRVKPENGKIFYFVALGATDGARAECWTGGEYDNIRFNRGICHATELAALIHAKALFSFSEVKS